MFGQLIEEGLNHVIARDEGLLASSVNDIGGPDKGHPILGHGRAFVHHFDDFLFRLHEYTWEPMGTQRGL